MEGPTREVRAPSRERRERSGSSFIQEPPGQMPRPPARGVLWPVPLPQPQWPPATVHGVDVPLLPAEGRVDPLRPLAAPSAICAPQSEPPLNPRRPGPFLGQTSREPLRHRHASPRSCLAVVPHTWLARPCAPFRGSRCIVDNKGMLAFCQGFVRTFFPLRHARARRGHPRLALVERGRRGWPGQARP